jgi:hypothetical protein
VSHLSSDSESGNAKKQDSNDKSEIYAAGGGGCDMAETSHYYKLKNSLKEIQG